MKRPQRGLDGKYLVNGKNYNELFGSRKQVWGGFAYKTAGNLTMDKLVYNKKTRRIVSRVKHTTAKKEKRLQKAGYFAKKGKFGYFKKTLKNKKHLGGDGESDPEPAPKSAEVSEHTEPEETTPTKETKPVIEETTPTKETTTVEPVVEPGVEPPKIGGKKHRKTRRH
jgi:hypothetical protein